MRAIISSPNGETAKTNGATLQYVSVMNALKDAQRPLRVEEIEQGMWDACAVPRNANGKTEISAILQRLMKINAVYHPDIPNAPSRHYCLTDGVRVAIEF